MKYVYDHANEVLGERKNIVVKYMVQTRKMQLVKILQTQSALSAFRLMREKVLVLCCLSWDSIL